jgi:uncharacterized protein YndB with AHSA1/START domain
MAGLVATADVEIAASPEQVWRGLTDPDLIEQYMFGSKVETDWKPGSPISWKGSYEGRPYEDRGEIVEVVDNERLTMTHFSPLSGQPDEPGNYHTLTYMIAGNGDGTRLTLSQDNNATPDEAEHSRENWQTMLTGLKDLIEAENR